MNAGVELHESGLPLAQVDAIDAIAERLAQLRCTAHLIGYAVKDGLAEHAIAGLADSIGDLAERLEKITSPLPAGGAS